MRQADISLHHRVLTAMSIVLKRSRGIWSWRRIGWDVGGGRRQEGKGLSAAGLSPPRRLGSFGPRTESSWPVWHPSGAAQYGQTPPRNAFYSLPLRTAVYQKTRVRRRRDAGLPVDSSQNKLCTSKGKLAVSFHLALTEKSSFPGLQYRYNV